MRHPPDAIGRPPGAIVALRPLYVAQSWLDPPAAMEPGFAVKDVMDGGAFTVRTVVEGVEAQPSSVAMTVYAPASPMAAFVIVGFCRFERNPFGPVHAYVAPAIVVAVREADPPRQTGPSFPAMTVGGVHD